MLEQQDSLMVPFHEMLSALRELKGAGFLGLDGFLVLFYRDSGTLYRDISWLYFTNFMPGIIILTSGIISCYFSLVSAPIQRN